MYLVRIYTNIHCNGESLMFSLFFGSDLLFQLQLSHWKPHIPDLKLIFYPVSIMTSGPAFTFKLNGIPL